MNILISILSYHGSSERLKACLDTWVKNCHAHDLIILGDDKMPDRISDIEVYKPLVNEKYRDLPKKIKTSFEYLLTKEWDYLVKIDDDAYLNTTNLLNFLKNNTEPNLYAGQGVHFPSDKHPCYLSNVGDILPPKSFKYYYAQGGCYVISKKALEISISNMDISAPFFAEDLMVGKSMNESNILLEDRPDLFNCGLKGKGWHNMGTRKNTDKENIDLMQSGYISSHKLDSSLMIKIHNSLKQNN